MICNWFEVAFVNEFSSACYQFWIREDKFHLHFPCISVSSKLFWQFFLELMGAGRWRAFLHRMGHEWSSLVWNIFLLKAGKLTLVYCLPVCSASAKVLCSAILTSTFKACQCPASQSFDSGKLKGLLMCLLCKLCKIPEIFVI